MSLAGHLSQPWRVKWDEGGSMRVALTNCNRAVRRRQRTAHKTVGRACGAHTQSTRARLSGHGEGDASEPLGGQADRVSVLAVASVATWVAE